MSLSVTAVEKFKRLYVEEYGIELTEADAQKYATAFMDMMLIVCRPIDSSSVNLQQSGKEPAKSFIVPPRDLAVSGGTLSAKPHQKRKRYARHTIAK